MYSPFIPDAQKFDCFHIGNDADTHTNNGIAAFLTLLLPIPAADGFPQTHNGRMQYFCLET